MTSIEIINEYIKSYEHNLTCMHNLKVMKRQGELIKEMELVKKDLEVLEILKNKSSLISNEDSWLCLKIDKINMFKDEFDKIMRWLENE